MKPRKKRTKKQPMKQITNKECLELLLAGYRVYPALYESTRNHAEMVWVKVFESKYLYRVVP